MEMVTLRSAPALTATLREQRFASSFSYNVRYFGHATRGLLAYPKTSIERIARVVAGLRPLADIVCLQEVEARSLRSHVAHRGSETQLERFTVALDAALAGAGLQGSYEAYYFPAHAYRPLSPKTRGVHDGAGRPSRRRELEVDLHNAAGPHDITDRNLHPIRRFKQTRICAHLRLRVRGGRSHGPIDVFNTHLSLPSTLSRGPSGRSPSGSAGDRTRSRRRGTSSGSSSRSARATASSSSVTSTRSPDRARCIGPSSPSTAGSMPSRRAAA